MTQPPQEPEATRPDDRSDPGTASPGFPATPPQQGGYTQQGGYGPPRQPPTGPPPGYGTSQGFPPPAPGGYGPPPGQGGYGQPPAPGGYGPPQNFPPPPQSSPPPAPGGYGPPPGPGGYGQPAAGQPGSFQKQPSTPEGGYGDAPGFPPPAPDGYGAPQGQYGAPQAQYGPPEGQYGSAQGFPPPAAGSSSGPSLPPIDLSKVGTGDWVVLGLGVLLLIFSFFGWWSVSYNFLGVSQSYSLGGWNRFWWLAPLLILVVTGIRATQLLTGLLVKEIKTLWLLYAAVAAVVLYLISLIDIFVQTSDTGLDGLDEAGASASVGAGFGIWASIILSLAFVYFLALSLQARGEKLPVAVPGPKL